MGAVPITQQSVCPRDGTCLAAKAGLKAGLTAYEANYDHAVRGLPNELAAMPGAGRALEYFRRQEALTRERVRRLLSMRIETFAGPGAALTDEGLAFADDVAAVVQAHLHDRSPLADRPQYWFGKDLDEKHREFERSTISGVIVGQLVLADGNRRQAARDLNRDIRNDQKNCGATASWVRSGMRYFAKEARSKALRPYSVPFVEAGFDLAYEALKLEMLWQKLRGPDAHPVTWDRIEDAFETGWVFNELAAWKPSGVERLVPSAQLNAVYCEIEVLKRHLAEKLLAERRSAA